jgi:hypothetical protein
VNDGARLKKVPIETTYVLDLENFVSSIRHLHHVTLDREYIYHEIKLYRRNDDTIQHQSSCDGAALSIEGVPHGALVLEKVGIRRGRN